VCEKQKKGEGGTDCTSAENALPSSSAGQRGRREISGAIKRERAHNQEKKAGDNTQKKKQEKKENFSLNSKKKKQSGKKEGRQGGFQFGNRVCYVHAGVGGRQTTKKKKKNSQNNARGCFKGRFNTTHGKDLAGSGEGGGPRSRSRAEKKKS
jgi:hypothetical protein